jgi:hypothetical protein
LPDDGIPFRRPHRRTGRRRGAPDGNRNRWVHDMRSIAYTDGRRALMQLLREARAAVARANRGDA